MPEPQQNLKMIKEIFGDYKTRANIIEAKVLGLNLIKKKEYKKLGKIVDIVYKERKK